jgi:competence protein ComEA
MATCAYVCCMLALSIPFAPAQERLPSGPGRDTMKKVCSSCHSAENVVGLAKTREEWGQVVGDMAANGAEGTVDEFNDVVDYLTEHFPKSPPVNVNKATAKDLENSLGFSAKDAAAIVDYRGEKGNFKSVEEVAKVPGIDVKKVQARRDRLAF